MSCEEYWNDGGGEPVVDFEAHLAVCSACAARWEAVRPVARDLRLLAEEMKNVSAPPRVAAHLLRAYRERYPRRVRPVATVHAWWAAAAAAALLLAAGLLLSPKQPVRPLAAVNAVAAPALAAADEEDAGFVPLPNAAGAPQDDDVDLVRVELPRTAVTALGTPGSFDTEAGSVEAEVLVGPDGMARAVRFLN